jgi:hypothetical protein
MVPENTPLDFEELQHELHEFGGRVIRVEVRLDSGDLVARMEGQYAGVHSDPDDPDDVWLELGGKEPPEVEGLMFIVASWGAIHIPRDRFAAARREWTGIGAFVITIETNIGLRYSVWPAMPPRHQWTDMHNMDR